MKMNMLKGIVFTFLILFLAGCNKDELIPTLENASQAASLRSDPNGGCRMTSFDSYDGVNDVDQYDQFTYKNGLVDNIYTFYGWTFKLVYDAKNKLIASKVYVDDVQIWLMEFFYKNNKLERMTFRYPETGVLDDEVFFTYNQQGNLERSESFLYDLYATYKYTPDGSLESNVVFSGGLPFFRGDYTYNTNAKNPFRSLEGIDVQFFYGNPEYGSGTNWYSSEKITLYDENGNPDILYEQDPAKTTWESADQHYPLKATHVDMPTQGIITNTFEYENCVPGQFARSENLRQNKTSKYSSLRDFKSRIPHYPSKETIDRLRKRTTK
jgi:antitoxin component YwqK of YwqJK toxin-antitoxin module